MRKSRDKRRQAAASTTPTVVCTANSPNSNNIELGLVILLMIVCVYVFGFYESVVSVPDVSQAGALKGAVWYQHMGENLNVARSEFNAVARHGSPVNNHNNNPKAEAQRGLNKGANQEGKGTGVLNMPFGVPDDQIEIPEHKWPVTVRDEVDDYEDLLHTGDMQTILKVPKLWSLPVHNYKLMTRERAMKIGSCAEPDENGNVARGDDCPLDQRTIYVGIASYRDFECRTTVESIFLRAKNPHRIRVGK